MKKIIAIAAALVAFAAVASAQPRALGVRAGWGTEISYQHNLGNNFAEADLGMYGWGAGGFILTGIYDFVLASEGNFNFYAGPGATLGVFPGSEGSKFNLAVSGQVGVEYNFNIPLTLSLDWRPSLYLINGANFGWQGFALGIRYRF